MNSGIVQLQVYVLVMILASGCQNEIFLMPDSVTATEVDSDHSYEKMLDKRWWDYWEGQNQVEDVFYRFDLAVNVKKLVVQRYFTYLDRVTVYSSTFKATSNSMGYRLYADDGGYEITTIPVDFKTSVVKFRFVKVGSYPRVSRAEVWGCYDTTRPTNVPATSPSGSPSTSPTLQPTTTLPSWEPSTMPTTSPTILPSVAVTSEAPSIIPTTSPTFAPTYFLSSEAPSTMPTISPTLMPTTSASPSALPTPAPTKPPSTGPSISPTVVPTTSASPSALPTHAPTKPPSIGPSISPTVGPTLLLADGFKLVLRTNDLMITAGVIILCGALLMILHRCRKKKQVLSILGVAESNARSQHRTDDIEDYEGDIQVGKLISVSELEPAAESFC